MMNDGTRNQQFVLFNLNNKSLVYSQNIQKKVM